MNHYVYQITYFTGKKYIGCRSCKCLPEEDTKYTGSSKHTPNNQIKDKKVLKTFLTRKDAVAYEVFLHNKYDVHTSKDYYNQAKQSAVFFDTQGLTASSCAWVAAKAKRRVLSHLEFVKNVYLRHKVWIEYLSEYRGMTDPITFKCPECSNITTVNKASNHYHRQVCCKQCTKKRADGLQKLQVGDNRTLKQKLADIKRSTYKGTSQTSAQLEGRKKASKTATGQKCKSRGKPGVTSVLFKPWYYITPEGARVEHKDITITQFIESKKLPGITRSNIFYATYRYPGKPVPKGTLQGYTFGFL